VDNPLRFESRLIGSVIVMSRDWAGGLHPRTPPAPRPRSGGELKLDERLGDVKIGNLCQGRRRSDSAARHAAC
jgi:hypothetical protein